MLNRLLSSPTVADRTLQLAVALAQRRGHTVPAGAQWTQLDVRRKEKLTLPSKGFSATGRRSAVSMLKTDLKLLREPTPVQTMHGILSGPFATAAKTFLSEQRTVCYDSQTQLKDCMKAMEASHIRSCMIRTLPHNSLIQDADDLLSVRLQKSPVRPSGATVQKYFAMLDMRDVLKCFLEVGDDAINHLTETVGPFLTHSPCVATPSSNSNQSSLAGSPNPILKSTSKVCQSLLFDAITKTMGKSCQEIANASGKNSFVPCWIDDCFDQVIRAFETSPRVPIFEWVPETGVLRLVRIFSATDLFALLHKSEFFSRLNEDALSAFDRALAIPAAEVSSTGNQVITARESDPLLMTMRRLSEFGFTALPIVEQLQPWRVLGVISVRDFRSMFLRPHELRIPGDLVLFTSTMTYVCQIRQVECLKAKFPSISVREHTPLRQVVHKMLAADIQRILLLDDEGKLSGVFSRTDLGRLVARTIEELITLDIQSG